VTPAIAAPGAAVEARLVAGLDYSYAFQPIVDVLARSVFSYEALVRGPDGASAAQVFERVAPDHLHRFDQESRVAAIELASRLRLPCKLNLNFLPRSLYTSPAAVRSALEAAERCGITPDRLVLEITESEVIDDFAAFGQLINEFRRFGLQLAIDDFGAGYAGLTMLADFQPDLLKLDMSLVRGIEGRGDARGVSVVQERRRDTLPGISIWPASVRRAIGVADSHRDAAFDSKVERGIARIEPT